MRNRQSFKKNGFLTSEYAVMFVALVVVIIAVSSSIIKPAYNRLYNGVGNILDDAAIQMETQGRVDWTGGTGGVSGSISGDSEESSSGDTDEPGGGSTGSPDTGESGGSSSGGTAADDEDSDSGTSEDGGSSGEASGGETEEGDESTPVPVSTPLEDVFNLLGTSTLGSYYNNLIENNRIFVGYEDREDGLFSTWNQVENKISVNPLATTDWPSAALAAAIAHEATHADYDYNSQEWIDDTLERHPELGTGDLHITVYPGNSIDQEYMACCRHIAIWNELKGDQTNAVMDSYSNIIAAGEDFAKVYLKGISGYADLPDY